MGHNHHTHSHDKSVINEGNLLISALLNLIITIAEIIGGIISNSLALLSDALHNLGDTSAVTIAYLANLISKRITAIKKLSDTKGLRYWLPLLTPLS